MTTVLLALLVSLYHGAVALGLPQSAMANAMGDSGEMTAPQLLRKEVAAVIDTDKDVLDTIDESMTLADAPDSSIRHPIEKKSTDFLLSDDDDPLQTADAMDDFEKWTEEYSAESSDGAERSDSEPTVTKGQAPRQQASKIPAVLAADSSNWPQQQQISAKDSLASSIQRQRQAPISGRMPLPYEAANSHALKVSNTIASGRPVATPEVRPFVSRPSGLQANDQSRAALSQIQDKQRGSINGNRATEKEHNSRVMDEASLVDEDPVVKRAYMAAEQAAQDAAAAQERAETAAQQLDEDVDTIKAHEDQAIKDEESVITNIGK